MNDYEIAAELAKVHVTCAKPADEALDFVDEDQLRPGKFHLNLKGVTRWESIPRDVRVSLVRDARAERDAR